MFPVSVIRRRSEPNLLRYNVGVVTAAMEGMSFLQPVRVGDTVRCYAHVEKIGRTSMTIPVEVWVTRYMTGEELRVTHGVFTLVAVDESGKPIPVKRGSA